MTATLWRRDEMRLALARHEIDTMFRLMQRYGYSQSAIGRLVRLSQSEVSSVINGRMIRDYAVFERIVEGIGIPRGWAGVAFDDETAALRAMDALLSATVQRFPAGWNPGRPTARYSNETRHARKRAQRLLDL